MEFHRACNLDTKRGKEGGGGWEGLAGSGRDVEMMNSCTLLRSVLHLHANMFTSCWHCQCQILSHLGLKGGSMGFRVWKSAYFCPVCRSRSGGPRLGRERATRRRCCSYSAASLPCTAMRWPCGRKTETRGEGAVQNVLLGAVSREGTSRTRSWSICTLHPPLTLPNWLADLYNASIALFGPP